jgi:hypothetical protein
MNSAALRSRDDLTRVSTPVAAEKSVILPLMPPRRFRPPATGFPSELSGKAPGRRNGQIPERCWDWLVQCSEEWRCSETGSWSLEFCWQS